MIKIISENLLNCTEDIIVHQVNPFGTMGAGVARQLANKYKGLEENYNLFCNIKNYDYNQLKGEVFKTNMDNKIICNMFSQMPDFTTDYPAMEKALKTIKNMAKDLNLTVCMPYKIGCGTAYGNWEVVEEIIMDVFYDYEVTLYRLGGANEYNNNEK